MAANIAKGGGDLEKLGRAAAELVKKFLAEGKADEAERVLREAAAAGGAAAELALAPARKALAAAQSVRKPTLAPPGAVEPSLQLPLRAAEALDDAGRDEEAARAYEAVAAMGAGDKPTLERFLALARLARYEEAFVLGRALAKHKPTPWEADMLSHPWRRGEGKPARARLDVHLPALRRSAAAAPKDPWPRLYLLQLLLPSGGEGVLELQKELPTLIPRSLSWMNLTLGRLALMDGRLEEAQHAYAVGSRSTSPAAWRCDAFRAEALVCLGRQAEGLLIMGQAVNQAGAAERGDALGWLGELLLWLGRYEEALVPLKVATEANARFSWCWYGAAKIRLGRVEEGLADVERGLSLYPRDMEAVSWRAEALRQLGRPKESIAALSGPLKNVGQLEDTRPWTWHLANRALAHRADGDLKSAQADIELIDGPARFYLSKKTRDATTIAWLDALECLFEASHGYRRPEDYGWKAVGL